jgi:C-terminal processing protease CtpA/Prc
MFNRHLLTLALAVCVMPAAALAQDGPHAVAVDAAERTAVIASLSEQLRTNYVFPDVAKQLSAALIAKNAKGGYALATDTDLFSEALSKDLRDVGKDGHFRIAFAPGAHPRAATLGDDKPSKEELEQMRREISSMGYGIQRVERLNGNVGYIEVRGFGPTEMVGEALSGAMTLLSGTDAMILDLRRNGGGEPSTVAYLMSHFFAAGDKRHLNDIYTRPTNKTEQYWTTPSVGTHYTKPLYVLTSARTFSGGEEFAYDAQTQKRATLVGETTGGGANPGDDFAIGHDFVAFIPTGRSINPITHTNWEHVGVKPDVATPAADAQKTAYAAILRKLLADARDPDQREELQDTLHKVETGAADVPNYAAHH